MKPKPTGTPTDPVVLARMEVQRLRDREIEIWHERRQLAAGLHDLETRTGKQVAAGGNADEAARQLSEGDARLHVQDQAADEIVRQREAAVPLIRQARAATLRKEAAAVRAEAAAREPRTIELLAELREREQVEYEPKVLIQATDIGQLSIHRFPSLTAVQRATADRLDFEATVLEHRDPDSPSGGQVSASSVDELIALALGDGERAVPHLRDIEAWASATEQAGRKRLRRIRDGYFGTTPDPETGTPTWTLTWRTHEIVRGESHVSFLGLTGRVIDGYFDVAAGLVPVGERQWIRPDSSADIAKLGPLADEPIAGQVEAE